MKDSTSTIPIFTQSMAAKKSLFIKGQSVLDYYMQTLNKRGYLFSTNNTLLIMLGGRLHLKFGNQVEYLDANQMAFLKRNTVFDYIAEKNENAAESVEWILFNITHEIVTEYYFHTQLQITTFQNNIFISQLEKGVRLYVNALIAYLQGMNTNNEIFNKLKLFELLCCLADENPVILNLLVDITKELRPDITTILDKHITEHLTMRQLARLCGRSLSSFRRDFQSIYHMSPSQWIREKRLVKSEEMLRCTQMHITDICYTLGFENIAHFSRLFKSKFGKSPSAYRTELKVA